MSETKYKVYDTLYAKLGIKEEEKDIYRLTKAREKKRRASRSVRCVKDKDNKVLVKDDEIKQRWKGYFCKLFNVNHECNIVLEINNTKACDRIMLKKNYSWRNTGCPLKEIVGKGVGPDSILIEL